MKYSLYVDDVTENILQVLYSAENTSFQQDNIKV